MSQTQTGASPAPTAGLGTQVELELISSGGETETLRLILVPDEQADFASGFLGIGTPLAQAVEGHAAGEKIDYTQGGLAAVRIHSVQPAPAAPPDDIAARRAERLRQAVEQVQRTDAMIFASSFSGKWGDYDPGGIEHWEQPQPVASEPRPEPDPPEPPQHPKSAK